MNRINLSTFVIFRLIMLHFLCFTLFYGTTTVRAESPIVVNTTQKINVKVYVCYDYRETFIHLGPWNYPEVATLTFVAVQIDPITKKNVLYDGGPGPILVKIVPPIFHDYSPAYQFIKVTDGQNEMFRNRDHIAQNWGGLFYELDHDGLGPFLSNFSKYGGDNDGTNLYRTETMSFLLGGAYNPTIIAVESWNYKAGAMLNLAFWVGSPDPDNVEVELMSESQGIDIDSDNCNLVRENIYKNGGIISQWPKKGTCYTEDPGPWIIDFGGINKTIDPETGKGTAYAGFLHALVNAEKYKGPRPVTGGGADWLQVAAAERCSENTPVYNSVWKIDATINSNTKLGHGYQGWIELNPFVEMVRFNKRLNNVYEFSTIRAMEDIVDHEALHAYHFLPGNSVYDYDGDSLYVNSATENTQNPFLKFSFDSKSRGFMTPLGISLFCTVDKWSNGYSGDHAEGEMKIGRFITKMQLTSDSVEGLFGDPEGGISPTGFIRTVPTLIPNDLPMWDVDPRIVAVFLYKPTSVLRAKDRKIYAGWIRINKSWTIKDRPFGERQGRNGYYVPGTFEFACGPYQADIKPIEKIVQLIKIYGYTELAILYEIEYRHNPYEYDASYFADIGIY